MKSVKITNEFAKKANIQGHGLTIEDILNLLADEFRVKEGSIKIYIRNSKVSPSIEIQNNFKVLLK